MGMNSANGPFLSLFIRLQPELYKNELTRQPSTDESTCNEHVGQLQYSLKYDQELETLIVKVGCSCSSLTSLTSISASSHMRVR